MFPHQQKVVGMVDVTGSATSIEAPDVLRRQFLLDPEIVFLNHGSFGATPRPVFDVYQDWQRQLEHQPVHFVARRQEALLDEARAQLASYVNAGADDISFVVNSTSGLNVIARSLPLEPGDEVLTTNLEYGALDYTWEFLCEKAGARYVAQEIRVPFTTPEAIVEEFWSGVTERTRAIFLSHITSATAVTLPVREICARARDAGILTIVDGAHVPGQIPLDLEDVGADIYAGNCHKWLCAPKGAAFLYVRPEHQDWVESLTISWGWRPDHTFVTRNQLQGTRDISAFLTVPAAIEFQREHDWDAIRVRCHEQLREFRMHMHDRLDTTPIYDDAQGWYAQMAVITLPDGDHAGLQDRLLFDHKVEVPLTAHNGHRFVRVSVQGYTSNDELSRFEAALCSELGI
jgi:isopenicillin-N epimerase